MTRNPSMPAQRMRQQAANSINLVCWQHGTHELAAPDTVRIVAALTAALYCQESDPVQSMHPVRTCPIEALSWSHDQEMYAEDVDALFHGLGLEDSEATRAS